MDDHEKSDCFTLSDNPEGIYFFHINKKKLFKGSRTYTLRFHSDIIYQIEISKSKIPEYIIFSNTKIHIANNRTEFQVFEIGNGKDTLIERITFGPPAKKSKCLFSSSIRLFEDDQLPFRLDSMKDMDIEHFEGRFVLNSKRNCIYVNYGEIYPSLYIRKVAPRSYEIETKIPNFGTSRIFSIGLALSLRQRIDYTNCSKSKDLFQTDFDFVHT